MDLSLLIKTISEYVFGLPLMLCVIAVGIICTIALNFIQFRHFFTAWRSVLKQPKTVGKQEGMTQGKAFLNTVNSNLGNGSIAGMATAIYSGGPGSAFWVVMFGFVLMSIRFLEVYISALFGSRVKTNSILGGPMLYLKSVIGGEYVAYSYALFCFFYGLAAANAIQVNAIKESLVTTWNVPPLFTAIVLVAFILYILFGGASRIVDISARIVPIKVAIFTLSSLTVLIYHYQSLFSALHLIVTSAFSPVALSGGIIGFSVQQAVRFGMSRSIFSTESGLGSAAILFGFTGSDDSIRSGLMGMVSAAISTLVMFIIALCIVVSGVWEMRLSGTALTIASFNTVFGQFGGWIVSFLAVSFGFGVLVTWAYIVRAAWLFLTNGKYPLAFVFIYSSVAFVGSLAPVDIVWDFADIILGGMLLINLFGLMFLLPQVRKELNEKMRNYRL